MARPSSPVLYDGGLLAVSVACATLVLTAVSVETTSLRWLSWTALVWLGEISYALYLWHPFVFAEQPEWRSPSQSRRCRSGASSAPSSA